MEPSFFSYEQIAAAVVIFLALAAAFLLVGNCVDKVRGWVYSHKEKQQQRDNKIDYLKDKTAEHNNNYKDVVSLKKQVGEIQESVEKIDKTLDGFIKKYDKEMGDLNEETALQTGVINCLLDNSIRLTDDETYLAILQEQRRKVDEFLIHRGR